MVLLVLHGCYCTDHRSALAGAVGSVGGGMFVSYTFAKMGASGGFVVGGLFGGGGGAIPGAIIGGAGAGFLGGYYGSKWGEELGYTIYDLIHK